MDLDALVSVATVLAPIGAAVVVAFAEIFLTSKETKEKE